MKKIYSLFVLIIFLIVISGCSVISEKSSKIKVVASLFPQYDFAKNIGGDKVEVSLLLPPGTESHTFDPSPKDVIKIHNSDLFLYTGKYMEPWADRVISGVSNKSLKIVDVSSGVNFKKDEHHEDEEDDNHEHDYDPHIWLDPIFSCQMVDNIKDSFCEKDPDNKDFYTQNANEYKNKLVELDMNTQKIIDQSKRKIMVFGGRFAHLYFIERYKLDYKSVFDGCSTEAEPSLQKIKYIIDFINENNIPCIYYEEFSEPKVANAISEQANIKTLKFSTAHNVTKDQLEAGTSYLDIMHENLENLKIGLN